MNGDLTADRPALPVDATRAPTISLPPDLLPRPAGRPASTRDLRDLLQRGAIGRALTAAEALRDSPAFASGPDGRRSAVHLVIIECRLARGDLVEAMASGDDLGEHLGTVGRTAAFAYYGKAALAAALGDPHQAAELFASSGEHAGGGSRSAALLPWRAGASLALLHTRTRGAADLAAEHLELVRPTGSAPAIALALRTTAMCDGGGRRIALLRDALVLLDGVTAERLAAQIATDLAEMLALTNDPATRTETLSLLRRAESYASREQLWPLRGRVRRSLDRLGEQPAPHESERLATLTKGERRTAELAASGLSNRAIAERLGVAVKSVEWHLSRAYRKLGIRSRSELTPLFGREG